MKKIFFTLIIASIFLCSFSVVRAAGLGDAGTNLTGAVKNTGLENKKDVITTAGGVINALLAVVGTIFFVLTIYAGVLWMTAAGEEEKVTKATNILKAAVIGLFIVMSAYAITAFVTAKLGVTGGRDSTSGTGTGSGGTGGEGGGQDGGDCSSEGGACLAADSECSSGALGIGNDFTGDRVPGVQCSGNMICCEYNDDEEDRCTAMGGRCTSVEPGCDEQIEEEDGECYGVITNDVCCIPK